MAQSTIPDLLESPGMERVGIAGRNAQKAKVSARQFKDDRATPIVADARDPALLVKEMKAWDVVINSAWYDLNVPIMEAAIRAGIHYIDLGGLYHQTIEQLKRDRKAKDAGVTCVLGIGSTPGTMNVMGMYGAIQGIGAIVGPLLTGVVAQVFGYPAAFAVTVASILAGIAILAIDRVPER